MMGQSLLTVIYIIAAVTFILGLKMLSNPTSARKGNLIAAFGMTAAIFATIFYTNPKKDIVCTILAGSLAVLLSVL